MNTNQPHTVAGAGNGARRGWLLSVQRAWNRWRTTFSRPHVWISFVFVVVFGYLILVPVANMVYSSFHVQSGDERRASMATGTDLQTGDPTLFYWERLFATEGVSRQLLYEPLLNTLFVSLSYTIIAMTIGVSLAFLMVKTDMPFKSFSGFCAIVPYILPSWTLALAWITVFGSSEIGVGAAGVVEHLRGVPTPRWLAYGPFPIISVLAINYFAYGYLLASSALSMIDASLEEAGLLHGAGNRLIARRITLPIILPALGSATILTFADGLGTFGVPAFLGMPVRYRMLATSLYQSAGVGRRGDVFVYTLVLIAFASFAIFANSVLMGKRKQFTTITGKGAVTHRVMNLGRWRVPVGLAVAVAMGTVTFLPVFFLVFQSFQYTLGVYSLDNLTLTYWIGERAGMQGVLASARVRAAARNTLFYGLSVATATAFIGILVGYCVSRNRGRPLSRIVEQISFIPYVVPGIAFGAIFLTMFSQPRGPIPALYGTLWILFLAGLVNRLPFAGRTGISAMMQLSPSLEESAEVHGAGFGRRLRRILLPLTKRGFMGGFLLSFVSSVKDLNLIILLVTPRTMVLAALTFGYIEMGRRQFADAIGVIIVVMVLSVTLLAQFITKTNPLRGFGEGR